MEILILVKSFYMDFLFDLDVSRHSESKQGTLGIGMIICMCVWSLLSMKYKKLKAVDKSHFFIVLNRCISKFFRFWRKSENWRLFIKNQQQVACVNLARRGYDMGNSLGNETSCESSTTLVYSTPNVLAPNGQWVLRKTHLKFYAHLIYYKAERLASRFWPNR